MKDVFSPFREVLADRHGWIKNYKSESGRQVAGYFCDYLPEEVLHAAGMIPIRITGGRGNVMAADKYLQSNVCSFARRCLDQAMEGVFDYLDGLAVPHSCDVITKMHDLWAYRLKDPGFVHYVWVPHKVFDESAKTVMEGEVKRLMKSAGEYVGKPIEEDALVEAIKVYDKSRELLKRIYELRKSDPPKITGQEAFSISLASILSPKDLFNQWAQEYLKEREEKPSELEKRPRILISASMIDDLQLIDAVEDSGAWVVADDLCTGSRYFWDQVGEVDGNPVKAIANRYLNKVPCPRSVDSMKPRTEHLLNLARDYKVDGVIFYILRCCDAHLFQYPALNERLRKEGLNVLYIQGDQTVGINEAIQNRIQAFTEMLSS